MQQQYNQYPQGQQQYQQPQAPQYQQLQYQPQPEPQPPRQPKAKKTVFGIITTVIFASAVLFELIALIMLFVYGTNASEVVSYLLVIFGLGGIAAAPFFKRFTKVIALGSALLFFLGEYGLMILNNLRVGHIFFTVGVCSLLFLVWLAYLNNRIVKTLWYVPAIALGLGLILIPIIDGFFSFYHFYASLLVYYIFELLFMLTIVGGAIFFGLYLAAVCDDKGYRINIPSPAAKPARPQPPQPSQAAPQQPQQPQYQHPQQPQYQQPQYQPPQQPQYQPPQAPQAAPQPQQEPPQE